MGIHNYAFIGAHNVACCRHIFAPAFIPSGAVNFVNMLLSFKTEEIIAGSAGQEISRQVKTSAGQF